MLCCTSLLRLYAFVTFNFIVYVAFFRYWLVISPFYYIAERLIRFPGWGGEILTTLHSYIRLGKLFIFDSDVLFSSIPAFSPFTTRIDNVNNADGLMLESSVIEYTPLFTTGQFENASLIFYVVTVRLVGSTEFDTHVILIFVVSIT